MNEILSKRCHLCNREFAVERGEGVICDNCNKPTCNRHLASTHKVEEKRVYICSDCYAKSTEM